ncbi:Beta-hexosaminidase 1 [Hondaea fermentalgiana]|uniref:beta-N-acetylhexosaminidase n=1 Tax=Hondaea fermentalgiana TaxID=2315210 RepID=A0A2R5GGQ0_9STRA|nr:Beta-hexosaminidase 1 [Hondaea fermentalgiana]|eukprot:GBG30050.1 Beta-hexosaminidase 1 [Hondaea fermentalgiana]
MALSTQRPHTLALALVLALFLALLRGVAVSGANAQARRRDPDRPLETNVAWEALPENLPFPLPAHVMHGTKRVRLNTATFTWDVEKCGKEKGGECALLKDAIGRIVNLIFSPSHKIAPSPCSDVACLDAIKITVQDASSIQSLGVDESYSLQVTDQAIQLEAATMFGAIHGLETFSQLVHYNAEMAVYEIAHADWDIRDAPRFPHRELLVDSSRHYIPIPTLRKILDGMAHTKINVLHWHLMDDQSFPWCSESVPELCKGAYNGQDKYTSGDLRSIVAYAHARGIRVMPELDIPGHSKSWCVGRPDICTARKEVITLAGGGAQTVISKLMAEIHDIFPDTLMHLGGDEVNWKTTWAKDPATMKYAQDHHLDAKQLYLEFVKTAHAEASDTLGVTPVSWEEVFVNFGQSWPKTSIFHYWLRSDQVFKAIGQGFNVLHSPVNSWYFDGQASYKATRFTDPCGKGTRDCSLVLGGGGASRNRARPGMGWRALEPVAEAPAAADAGAAADDAGAAAKAAAMTAAAGSTARVVNGVASETADYPFLASLVVTSSSQSSACGGTYIGRDGDDVMVLTAAHCLADSPSSIEAYFLRETLFQSSVGEIGPLYSSQYYIHDGFVDYTDNNGGLQNDVGLVRFPLDAGTELSFDPVLLPTANSLIGYGVTATMAGWGVLSPESTTESRSLYAANTSTMCLAQCSHEFFRTSVDLREDWHICAGADGVSICYGDSGGPLLMYVQSGADESDTSATATSGSYVQIGITSFSADCDTSLPDVFTRVSTYESLLRSQVPSLQSIQVSANSEGHCDLTFKLAVSAVVLSLCVIVVAVVLYVRRARRMRQKARDQAKALVANPDANASV